MDLHKKTWLTFAAGMFLVMAAILSGEILAGELERLNGEAGLDKIIISPLYSGRYQGQDRLEIADLEKLQAKLDTHCISYSTSQNTVAEFEGRSIEAHIVATDALYTKFAALSFIKGGYWNACTDSEQGRVAVLDRAVATELFGSTDIIGMTFELEGKAYKIIGVAEQNSSAIKKLFQADSCHIYVPISAFMKNNPEAEIKEIQIAGNSSGRMDTDEIKTVLSYIGKSPEKYNLSDFRKKKQLLLQKSRLIVFFIGFLAGLLLLKLERKTVRKVIYAISEDCKTDFLQKVIRKRYKELLRVLAVSVVLLYAAWHIWQMVRFELYIPAELIPDELTDLAFFRRLVENKLHTGITSLEQFRPLTAIQCEKIGKLYSFIFFILTPLGFALLHAGCKNMRLNQGNIPVTVLALAVILAAEVTACLLLLGLAGLPVFINRNSVLIMWGFVFLKSITIYLDKEASKC